MESRFFENEADFFGMFEEDTFDKEKTVKGVWKGYVEDDNGKLTLAAEFRYNEDKSAGLGWYDEELI